MEQNEVKDKIAPLHAEIFRQLSEIPQFQEYLDTHYDIHIGIDDENQYLNVQVQVLSFEESLNRLEEIQKARAANEPKIIVPESKIIT